VAPVIFSAGLFGLYWLIRSEPLILGRTDSGPLAYALFGPELYRLLFLAFVPLIFLCVRIFDTFLFDLLVTRRRNVGVRQLLRDIVSIVLYVVLFATVLAQLFDYKLTAVFAGSTLIAAIVGLALQDTLGNLLAGVALHMEDSFEVGDVLHSGEFTGVVEGVTWRATRMRTFNNDVVFVPNSLIARERIEVFPRNNLNGRILPIGIDYHVPPATVLEVLVQAAAHVDGVAREIPCVARMGGFGDSSVTYEIKYFTRDYSARDRIDAEIRKAVWYALRRNGIAFATPIRSYTPYTPPQSNPHEVPREELLERLKEVDVLSPLSDGARQTVAGAAKVHFYSKGETILTRGAAGDSMFVVHDGSVSVRVPDSDSTGGTREVALLQNGSVFGEMALLTGETRMADVIAAGDTIAIEITKDALQPILQSSPELAHAISAKISDRRDRLESQRAGSPEETERTVLSRIRAYFGL